jgi:cytochrome c5
MSDREFMKYFSIMIGALIALTVVLYVLAGSIGGKTKIEKASADNKAVAERIKPVGEVTVAAVVANAIVPSANAAGANGKATYDTACMACHGAGVAGAPKLGDKAAWKDRIAQGNAKLYEHALKGFQGKKGFMPAKGGNASLKDDAVKAAVDFMVAQSK